MNEPNTRTPIIPGEALIRKQGLPLAETRTPEFAIGIKEEYLVATSLGVLASTGIDKFTDTPFGVSLVIGFCGVLAVEQVALGRLARNGYIKRVQ